jgi:signal peptidase I
MQFFRKKGSNFYRLFGVALIGLLFIFRIDWLATLCVFILLTEFFIFRKFSKKGIWLYVISLPFCVLFLAIFFKLFIAEVFVVPSDSMENTLFPGNKILVSKLNYGAAVPGAAKDIPWLGILFAGDNTLKASPSDMSTPLFRTKGFSKIKRGDVVVFRIRYGGERFLVKRCIGLPGDRVTLRDSALWVNDKLFSWPLVKYTYLMGKNNNTERMDLSGIQVDSLKMSCPDCSLKVAPDTGKVYPYSALFPWSRNFWGPIVVPRKGLRVPLDLYHLALYEKLIRSEVAGQAETKPDGYYINGRKETIYIFQKDYYIMLGDNRDNSADSRFWGFCPAENVVGKVII